MDSRLSLVELKLGDRFIAVGRRSLEELFDLARRRASRSESTVLLTLCFNASPDMTEPACIEEHMFYRDMSYCYVRTMGEVK